MKKPKKKQDRIGRGAPGHYNLNQKFQRFEDRRTRRNRSRAEMRRNAIRDFAMA